MTKLEELTRYIKKLSADAISTLLDTVKILLAAENTTAAHDCPYCGSAKVIRYGHKCGKQRFFCNQCGRTFVTTTHTIMSRSHFSDSIWQEVIRDTVQGHAIDYSAKKLGINHRTVFDMRHKILLALQELPETEHILLGGVAELDETFVLENLRANRFRILLTGQPADTEQKLRNEGFPVNISASVLAYSAKGKLMLPLSTAQNRMRQNWQVCFQNILPRARWCFATA